MYKIFFSKIVRYIYFFLKSDSQKKFIGILLQELEDFLSGYMKINLNDAKIISQSNFGFLNT